MFCAGKGRMFKCLQESLAQPDFGQACRAQVEERGQRMQEDYRLDYGVAEACEPDVTTYCAAEKVTLALAPLRILSLCCTRWSLPPEPVGCLAILPAPSGAPWKT